ncbi:MAG: helix-turn-helix transcriptional regulator [Spirochaetes bacterium]|nr:helix-turn-helix transcriptional regulator [Spirochaetota bacterium]
MIGTGIDYLDRVTGGLRLGDNVAWESADGATVEHFIRSFFKSSPEFKENVIYISFNFSPNTILRRYEYLFRNDRSILIDAFTHGKGNSDGVFLDFYKGNREGRDRIICVDKPSDIGSFVGILNEVERKHREGSFYIFDGLTGMNELWKNEAAVLDFFAFTCPKLYDLNALAYWVFHREAHSREFVAGIMHITQIVFSIRATDSDYYELKVQKLQDRTPLFGSRPSYFKIDGSRVLFEDGKAPDHFEIGEKVRLLRKEARMTQASLATSLNMTPGAVSQIENDIITPSLQTLVQLSAIFGKPVDYFIGASGLGKTGHGYSVFDRGGRVQIEHRDATIYRLMESEYAGMKPYSVSLEQGKSVNGPLMLHRGKEFITVTRGALEVEINGETILLEECDSLSLTDSFVTRWRSAGGTGCGFLYVLF